MSRDPAFIYPLAAVMALVAALLVALDITPARRLASDNYAIARVNGTPIPMAEYVRAVDAMQAGLERPLTQEDKARALRVLINEELIVQEALRLNLASDDRLVRKNLIQALINSVILEAQREAPEHLLREFFEKESALFAPPVQVSVKVLRPAADSIPQPFTAALQDGATFAAAGELAGFEEIGMPANIPIGKLGEALGGKARDAVASMQPGDIAGPIESTGGQIYIWLLNKDGGMLTYEQARDSVLAEWQRRQEELALERYVERLRKQARIRLVASQAEGVDDQ